MSVILAMLCATDGSWLVRRGGGDFGIWSEASSRITRMEGGGNSKMTTIPPREDLSEAGLRYQLAEAQLEIASLRAELELRNLQLTRVRQERDSLIPTTCPPAAKWPRSALRKPACGFRSRPRRR